MYFFLLKWGMPVNNRFQLQEIHTLSRGGAFFGFAVENLLLFKMNRAIHGVIECFPELDRLMPPHSSAEIEKAVNLLKSNRLLVPGDTPRPTGPQVPAEFRSMAIYLDHPCCPRPMPGDLLFKTMDFAVKEIKASLNPRIILTTSNPGEAVHTIDHIMAYVNKKHRGISKKLKWTLRTPTFPLTPASLSYLKKQRILLDWVFRLTDEKGCIEKFDEVYGQWKKCFSGDSSTGQSMTHGLATISSFPADPADIPRIVDTLGKMGFRRIYFDYWCYLCRSIQGGDYEYWNRCAKMITSRLFQVGWKPYRESYGFINHFPIAHRVLRSRRNHFGCAAGIHYAVISPEGNIFPCHSFFHEQRFSIGSVNEGIDIARLKGLGIQRVEERSKCSGCWGRYICGGGSNLTRAAEFYPACSTYLALVEQVLSEYEKFDLNAGNMIISMANWMDNAIPHRDTQSDAPVHLAAPRLLTVHGKSMRPILRNGDRVTVLPVEGSQIRIGDIVCFDYPPSCHRVVAKFKSSGEPMVLEKGDNVSMGRAIPLRQVYGKVVAIRKSGKSISLGTPSWWVLNRCIALLSLSIHSVSKLYFSIRKKGRLLWEKY